MKSIEIFWDIREEIKETPLWLDVKKVDSDWVDDRVEKNASNLTDNSKYKNFGKFIVNGDKIKLPICSLGYDGEFVINDGKSLFAWLRDHGAEAIPFLVPRQKIGYMQDRYGTPLNTTLLNSELKDLEEYSVNLVLWETIKNKEIQIQKILRKKPSNLLTVDKLSILNTYTLEINNKIEQYEKEYKNKRNNINKIKQSSIFLNSYLINKEKKTMFEFSKKILLEKANLKEKIKESNNLIETLTIQRDQQIKDFRNRAEMVTANIDNVYLELLKFRLKTQPITVETKKKIIENIDLALLTLKEEMEDKKITIEEVKKQISFTISGIKKRNSARKNFY